MKKFLTVLLATALVCGGLFTSCKQNDDDDDDTPATTVVLESSDAFTATAGSTTATVGDAVALSVAQAAANTKSYSETLSYAWTKTVGSGSAEAITLTDGKYTTVTADVGSVVFTCKITSTSYSTGVSVSTSAVTVSSAASEKTYNFVGLTFANVGAVLTNSDKATALTETEWTAATTKTKIYVASGSKTISDASIYGGSGNFQMHVASSASVDLTFNGGETSDISSSVTISSVSRYVSIPVSAAGTIVVTYQANASSSATGDDGQLGVYDADGAILGTVATVNLKNGDSENKTLTVTATKATTAYIVFSRNTDTAGGVKLYSVKYTPSN